MPSAPPSHTLNTGAKIPTVGLGTWQATEPDAIYNAILTALKAGYRHIDTAFAYGNEVEVGRAIRDGLAQLELKREDIFVTTKLAPIQARPATVPQAFEKSLSDLGLDYVDLYLLHWPVALNPEPGVLIPLRADGSRDIDDQVAGFEVTWEAMEKLAATGKTKAIGVCNFAIPNLERLLTAAKIPPAVNQIELHPYLPQYKLLEYCASKGIHVTAYSPLGSSGSPLLQDPTLTKIAEAHGVSTAQILISWGALRGTVIPKSVTPSRVISNFQLVDLTEAQVQAINDISKTNSKRFIRPVWGVPVFDEDFE
ncbi:Aldo/keto reductase [Hesseltinella vesiculosa]|uniref:Aldo/keto reductase n=1 Tax=Hesseltinella vesiculosa TaxID=101127 RepID=A0A1X2GID1_9FUNG|nr:Aldo/keto reductase [Hesseltinella vesiculosa]